MIESNGYDVAILRKGTGCVLKRKDTAVLEGSGREGGKRGFDVAGRDLRDVGCEEVVDDFSAWCESCDVGLGVRRESEVVAVEVRIGVDEIDRFEVKQIVFCNFCCCYKKIALLDAFELRFVRVWLISYGPENLHCNSQ